MADVAVRAGVSIQTVSRVLNSPDLVSDAVRQRVERVIVELGYRRNMSARALVTSNSQLIGVVTPADRLLGPIHTSLAIQDAARGAGYATIGAEMASANENPAEVLDYFMALGVDGIIAVAPTARTASAARRLAGTLPVIVVATGLPDPEPLHVVEIDHVQGARDATSHLISLGHERIAHIAGPAEFFDAQARIKGWRAELTGAGLSSGDLLGGGWEAADGFDAANVLLSQSAPPTAIFAANDYLALGAMRAIHQAGLRIPDDVAVVGYDDVTGSDHYEPPLTSVRQPFSDLARRAVDALLSALASEPTQTVPSRPDLIVRASSVG